MKLTNNLSSGNSVAKDMVDPNEEKKIINIINSSLSHIFALATIVAGGYSYKNK